MPHSARSAGPSATLDATFAALSDPTRRAILARLRHGPATVTDLASPFDLTLPAISKHLKVLEKAGLISRTRDAQKRPCQLEPARLREAIAWLQPYHRPPDAPPDRVDVAASSP